jgi:DNA-binding response OmpR family regulator
MKYSVIIADDDHDLLSYIKDVLVSLNCEAIVARNGHNVVDLARSGDFDLVIIGSSMECVDGIEAIKVIRMSEPDLPILALADGGCENMRIDALRAGAQLVLERPAGSVELIRAVRQLLQLPERSGTNAH